VAKDFSQHSVILLAAGSGQRLGAPLPKALVELDGRPLFTYSLEAFSQALPGARILLAIPKNFTNSFVSAASGFAQVEIYEGGETRQDSVRKGLELLESRPSELFNDSLTIIHDVARPFVSKSLILSAIKFAGEFGAVTIGQPASDTIVEADGDGVLTRHLDRSALRLLQTPQCFRTALLLEAHGSCDNKNLSATDDSQLVARIASVRVIEGDASNFKITTAADLAFARHLVDSGKKNRGEV
jgi:2-C-methyl-D-erythritol 4-phosphate cytidylyltransferase